MPRAEARVRTLAPRAANLKRGDAMSEDLPGWLRLAFADGIGPVCASRLLDHFKSPGAIFAASGAALEAAGLRPAQVRSLLERDTIRDALIDQTLAWATLKGSQIVIRTDPDYPESLANIHDPPVVLFMNGERRWLERPMLAMVGSRNATLHGSDTATELAQHLSQAGWTIVSGLALGIDLAAHQGALRGPGSTLAVLGCGIDRIYPRRHEALARQIAEQGALISELPPGTPPAAAFFPRRNRLIAGLAAGVIVVEAALQSGSLITARLASECGREVFAVPGPIRSGVSRGCHQLLREGATLVESAADILIQCPAPAIQPGSAELTDSIRPIGQTPRGDVLSDPLQRRILSLLQGGAAHPDQIAAHLGLQVHEIAASLLELELRGLLLTGAQGLLSPCQQGRELASAQFRLL